MKLKNKILHIGTLSEEVFKTLKDAILNTTKQEWLENVERQNKWEAHKDTQSIVLKIGKDLEDSKYTKAWDQKWKEVIEPTINQFLLSHYGPGEITRLLISKLKSKGKISQHRDTEYLLHFSHRVHIPIKTDQLSKLTIGNQDFTLAEGKLYEISNQDIHSASNDSNHERIHIIVDYADELLLRIMRNASI